MGKVSLVFLEVTGGYMAILAQLAPDFKAIMEKIINEVSIATGLTWIPVSTYRSIDAQNKLYEQGRSKAGGIVTNAKGGSSAHNFALACDCAPLHKGSLHEVWWDAPSGYWDAYGAFVKDNGMTWGGDFKTIHDLPHTEHPRWKEEQAKWKRGEVSLA